jgi:hypothetical protein
MLELNAAYGRGQLATDDDVSGTLVLVRRETSRRSSRRFPW